MIDTGHALNLDSVHERLAELNHFGSHFDELVEVLCDGAQYGPTPRLESRYASERRWIGTHYPALRVRLTAFLSQPPFEEPSEDRESGLDDFEGLVDCGSLFDLLANDKGSMISRITRAREALLRYSEHLRVLAARLA